VHPTKMEVRFQESGKLYSQMLRTLRHEFLTSDLTARARPNPGPVPAGLRNPDVAADQSERRWENHSQQVSQVTPQLGLQQPVPDFQPFSTGGSLSGAGVGHGPGMGGAANAPNAATTHGAPSGFSPSDLMASSAAAGTMPEHGADSGAMGAPTTAGSHLRVDEGQSADANASHLGFQVHQRYLVTQDEGGMVVVDQHALHERILYEQLRTKSESRSLESQKLLVPEPLDLSPAEAAAALDSREMLASIGIGVEPFGGDTVLMTSYPAILGRMRPAEILRQVLEPLMSGGKEPSAREVMDEIMHMLACKAAIKAGDKLAPEEITALLEQRDHYQDTHHCPHGRPTALFFSRDQLDKMFGRTS
ncbi:MAG: DNA mismatch repair protein MutL, partial [Planctomycetota bacterium]